MLPYLRPRGSSRWERTPKSCMKVEAMAEESTVHVRRAAFQERVWWPPFLFLIHFIKDEYVFFDKIKTSMLYCLYYLWLTQTLTRWSPSLKITSIFVRANATGYIKSKVNSIQI
jgi:hypothetical protein